MHDCFESVDVSPLLPSITAPVLLLSGDNSPIASAQQKALAETLPNGRVELFAGYGHGVNLLQPERCSRALWNSGDLTFSDLRRNTTATGDSAAAVGAILHRYKFDCRRVHRRDRPDIGGQLRDGHRPHRDRPGLIEGISAPGYSRDRHLAATQSRPAPDRPEENCEGPQSALSYYDPNRYQWVTSDLAN
jgi:hypothetical protein